ncbi:uncharacterized protein Dmoj_GI27018 [Drosophila mojavensis]|uniref:Uncharacterized protein n=1 Tax=Drosophila mojavensis TaxID=7230 RepID=A0A0Q9X2I8_DROMO|nr:uncharacterized protein Dmoj_GI27018 [Drosophila mojavensis]
MSCAKILILLAAIIYCLPSFVGAVTCDVAPSDPNCINCALNPTNVECIATTTAAVTTTIPTTATPTATAVTTTKPRRRRVKYFIFSLIHRLNRRLQQLKQKLAPLGY